MPRDHVTGHQVPATGRASRAGTCARAGLFAVLGTVLATFGHHAIAEGTVPWRPAGAMAVAQFAAVWPLAHRRCTPTATVACTLATQGLLHLVLSCADGDMRADGLGHATHAGHGTEVAGDGHAWHHAGAAMTLVHVAAALVVAWLLQRADAGMTAALGALRILAGAAVGTLAQALRRAIGDPGGLVPALPGRRPGSSFEAAAPAWDDVLEHSLVRRGPPRREHPPVRHPVPAATGPVLPVSARSSPVSKSTRAAARVARRTALAGAAALTATLALAAPAAAHAEVEADTSRALAENVTLSFVSEAESDSGGFTEVRVVLPEGIAPGDVTLGEAPKGWKLKATSDGYSVAGPALKTGVDAEHKIKVRQLPDAKEIAFKTVETYSDGEVSRWIELPSGGAEPEQPAPVLKLKAAAPGAKPVGPSPSSSTAESPAPGATPSAAESDAAAAGSDTDAKAAEADDSSSTGLIIGGALAVPAVLGGGVWWLVRRRGAASRS